MTEITAVVASGRALRGELTEKGQGTLWGDGNVLYHDKDVGSTDVTFCQNLKSAFHVYQFHLKNANYKQIILVRGFGFCCGVSQQF